MSTAEPGEYVQRMWDSARIKELCEESLYPDILISIARILNGEEEQVLYAYGEFIYLTYYKDDSEQIACYTVDIGSTTVFIGMPYSDQVDYIITNEGPWTDVIFAWEQALAGQASNVNLEIVDAD